jgi:hypothetical protein
MAGNRHDASTPSLQRRSPAQSAQQDHAGTPLPIKDWAAGMEHLWSQAGATGGNSSQGRSARQRFKQTDPQPVATDGNSSGAHGKEGVDGSSPSEGLQDPRSRGFCIQDELLFVAASLHACLRLPGRHIRHLLLRRGRGAVEREEFGHGDSTREPPWWFCVLGVIRLRDAATRIPLRARCSYR